MLAPCDDCPCLVLRVVTEYLPLCLAGLTVLSHSGGGIAADGIDSIGHWLQPMPAWELAAIV